MPGVSSRRKQTGPQSFGRRSCITQRGIPMRDDLRSLYEALTPDPRGLPGGNRRRSSLESAAPEGLEGVPRGDARTTSPLLPEQVDQLQHLLDGAAGRGLRLPWRSDQGPGEGHVGRGRRQERIMNQAARGTLGPHRDTAVRPPGESVLAPAAPGPPPAEFTLNLHEDVHRLPIDIELAGTSRTATGWGYGLGGGINGALHHAGPVAP